jgi:hypothetical protein
VGIVAGEPFGVAGVEVCGRGGLTFYVVADVEIADCNQQMRTSVMMERYDSAGLEFEFGDADSVFDKEDLFGAAWEDIHAAVFAPFSDGFMHSFVGYDLDGDVAKVLVRKIADHVSETARSQIGLAVFEFDGYGRLVLNGVDYFRGAERDIDVIMAVPVHQGVGMRRHVDVEDSDVFVF